MANRGRPKGSGNKPLSRVLSERLSERFPDYDPVMELVEATIRIKDIATESNDIALTVSIMKKRFDGSKSSGTDDADS